MANQILQLWTSPLVGENLGSGDWLAKESISIQRSWSLFILYFGTALGVPVVVRLLLVLAPKALNMSQPVGRRRPGETGMVLCKSIKPLFARLVHLACLPCNVTA